jgi:hypothetical protein
VANFNFESNEYASSPESILASFVWTVYEDVDVFIAQREPLFSPTRGNEDERDGMRELLDVLGLAWPEVLSQRRQTVTAIMSVGSGALAGRGLAGNELRLKMLGWEQARNRLERVLIGRYQEVLIETDESLAEFQTIRPAQRLSFRQRVAQRLSARARRRLRRLSSLLAYADIPLGSLQTLVPLIDPLIEVKQLIEQLAGDLGSESDLD